MSRVQDESASIGDLPLLVGILGVNALPARVAAVAAGLDVAYAEDAVCALADSPSPDSPFTVVRKPGGRFGVDPHPGHPDVVVEGDRARRVVERVGHDLLASLQTITAAPGSSGDDPDHEVIATTSSPPVVVTESDTTQRWTRDHHELVLAVVGAATTVGVPSLATALATALWTTADAETFDPDHAHRLTDAGVRAAIATRDPRTLASLLRSASTWFDKHDDHGTSEELAAREWEIWRLAGDTPMMIDSLWWRAGMFARRRRGDRELGCLERLESLYLAEQDRVGVVRARTAIGRTLLSYGRIKVAVEQLERADRAARALPEFPSLEQARLLEWSGRALWASGAHGPARRRFSAALALLADADEREADRMRVLLAHPESDDLPAFLSDRFPDPTGR